MSGRRQIGFGFAETSFALVAQEAPSKPRRPWQDEPDDRQTSLLDEPETGSEAPEGPLCDFGAARLCECGHALDRHGVCDWCGPDGCPECGGKARGMTSPSAHCLECGWERVPALHRPAVYCVVTTAPDGSSTRTPAWAWGEAFGVAQSACGSDFKSNPQGLATVETWHADHREAVYEWVEEDGAWFHSLRHGCRAAKCELTRG